MTPPAKGGKGTRRGGGGLEIAARPGAEVGQVLLPAHRRLGRHAREDALKVHVQVVEILAPDFALVLHDQAGRRPFRPRYPSVSDKVNPPPGRRGKPVSDGGQKPR